MTTLGQLKREGILSFSDGYRTKASEHADSGYRILRAGDVRDGRPIFDSPDFVDQRMAAAIGGKYVCERDVVLTTKGTVGRTAFVDHVPSPTVYSPQLCYFRADSARLESRYLYYWFSSAQFRYQASSLMSSTDMAPYISLSQLEGVEISLPELREQQAIAEVLGALDDKIAASRELVATSGQLLDSLHQKTRLGVLEPCTFEDVAHVGGGGTPDTRMPEYWGGHIPWAAPSDITSLGSPYLDETSRKLTAAGLAASSSPLYPEGSILMTSRATIGAFAVAQHPIAVNQGFIVVCPREEQVKWWLFHEMQRLVPEFINQANGATFLELPRSHFKKLAVSIPAAEVVAEFDAAAVVIHQRCMAATRESCTLAQLRDTLLPALMDGTLRVKDAVARAEDVL